MGQPVVHFEVIGKDGEKLRSYYSELFGWEFGDPIGPPNYSFKSRVPASPTSDAGRLVIHGSRLGIHVEAAQGCA
jgi:predicted enzyme related to lactoylglutathione lyase